MADSRFVLTSLFLLIAIAQLCSLSNAEDFSGSSDSWDEEEEGEDETLDFKEGLGGDDFEDDISELSSTISGTCFPTECQCDSDCKHPNSKCCRTYCGTLRCSADPCANSKEKPGTCPRVSKKQKKCSKQKCPGPNDACGCDNECPNNDKCCTDAYGRRTKPGKCPQSLVAVDYKPGAQCPSNCLHDSDCLDAMKCCPNICGNGMCTSVAIPIPIG
ncbi:hypothetical protein B566_EDAN000748 [Ephemera danica]|nr:hypothetical protein B566_EDAN000748 [Ephemera danica]